MNGRDEILRMMLSKNITPEEFNFDKLTAPPVEYFLTPTDIGDLVYLANSVKYSAKIDFKYKEIDRILKARGFELLGRGTNRVVYKYLENNQICLKVAVDHVGSTDNPKEFINQQYLKPFVSKVFHVDPSGTIAVAERVHPISTREEFLNYAEGIYDLITKWFIGKYVVNDIGTKFFMNWGIRYSTGMPVLLDYPYFYILDIRKAICHMVLEDGSVCNGDIDYDDGFNVLICTKCGRKYKAYELAKDYLSSLNAHSIVTGGKIMRAVVTIKRGSKEEKVVINPETKKLEEDYANFAKVSKRVVKSVIDQKTSQQQERKINKGTEASNISNSTAPKAKVSIRRNPNVSIVVNEHNKAENQRNNDNRNNNHNKKNNNENRNNNHKFKKNKHRMRISNSLHTEDNTSSDYDPAPYTVKVTVKGADNPVMKEKLDKIKDDIVIDNSENKVNIEVNEEQKVEEQISEVVVTHEDVKETTSYEEPEVEETVEDEVTENSDPNIVDAIQEAIEESANDTMDAADALDPDADVDDIMMAEEEIRRERDTRRSGRTKFDPSFYGNRVPIHK